MIASIIGTVSAIRENFIILENSGIGFLVYMPASSMMNLVPGDAEVTVYTHMSVKEDDISLYGFLTFDELNMFKNLITVSGIGPKGALAVLSDISVDKLKIAIVKGDAKLISCAQGIGLKTAQKICIELKSKYSKEITILSEEEDNTLEPVINIKSPEMKEALDVLMALGFSKSGSLAALRQIDHESYADASGLVSAALKII